jgi:subtilisin family serine protease
MSSLDLPAWSLPRDAEGRLDLPDAWPEPPSRETAWGGATGAGVRVCILDSGVQADHPDVGQLAEAVAVEIGPDGTVRVGPDPQGDLCGHGTACAGIVRRIAPECAIGSVRIVGAELAATGAALIGGLRHAVQSGYQVINLSLSSTRSEFVSTLHELADLAYFRRSLLVASAHNMPVESYPWRFAAVLSVGSHEQPDPFCLFANPEPPVEFFARGVDVEAPWIGGGRVLATGNSFATAHVSGLCALVLSKHPGLSPPQVKALLALVADNAKGAGS